MVSVPATMTALTIIVSSSVVSLSPASSAAMRSVSRSSAGFSRWSARACASIDYRGAGTLEFLVSGEAFYFIEMNTRLQVEHPVTELVTGIDLVRGQIHVAAGDGLPAHGRAERHGHAIEVRVNAEDPARGFLPAPGTVTRFQPPLGPGVRLDTHLYDGYAIPSTYDSLLAKLIVWDEDRPAAVSRASRALAELVIEGVPTTAPLAAEIMASDDFLTGSYTTSYLEEAAGTMAALAVP